MNTSKHSLRSLLLAAGLIAVPLSGQEQPGRVLEDLYRSIDQQLESHHQRVDDRSSNVQSLNARVDHKVGAFTETDNALERAEIQAEIIEIDAQINRMEREIVSDTITTLVGVLEDFSEIERVIDSRESGAGAIEARRRRLASVINNVGPILDNYEFKGSPADTARIDALKQNLVMMHRQLATPMLSTEGTMNQLRQTKDLMSDTVVQLRVVEELLQVERETLIIASHNAQAGAALMRLIDLTDIDGLSIAEVPMHMQNRAMERMETRSEVRTWSPVSPSSTHRRSSNRSAVDAAWEEIRRGNVTP